MGICIVYYPRVVSRAQDPLARDGNLDKSAKKEENLPCSTAVVGTRHQHALDYTS